jgi:hypothetical protein
MHGALMCYPFGHPELVSRLFRHWEWTMVLRRSSSSQSPLVMRRSGFHVSCSINTLRRLPSFASVNSEDGYRFFLWVSGVLRSPLVFYETQGQEEEEEKGARRSK